MALCCNFKALQVGLSGLPEANPEIRAKLDARAAMIGWPAMHEKLALVDLITAARLEPNDDAAHTARFRGV